MVKYGYPITYIIRSNNKLYSAMNNSYSVHLKSPKNLNTTKFLLKCQGVYCSVRGGSADPSSYRTLEFSMNFPSDSYDTISQAQSQTIGYTVFDVTQDTFISYLPFEKVVTFSTDGIYDIRVYDDNSDGGARELAVVGGNAEGLPDHQIVLSLTPIYE